MYAIINSSNEELEVKTSILFWQELGLSYTRTGYGNKIPSSYKVKYLNRWRRVYSIGLSNVSTEYIIVKGEKVIVSLSYYPL